MPAGYVHTVVLNDDINRLSELETLVSQYSNSQYNIVTRDQLYFARNGDGRAEQQICKLVASSVITTDYYCILDSKNYVNSSFDPKTFIVGNKTVNVRQDEGSRKLLTWQPEFDIWIRNSYQIFGLDSSQYMNSLTWTMTPYIMKTQYVRELLHYLKNNYISISNILGNTNDKLHCSEFYLYSAWLAKNNYLNEIEWIDGFPQVLGDKTLRIPEQFDTK